MRNGVHLAMRTQMHPIMLQLHIQNKKLQKNWKKVLTFPWGFVIIILALSDRAKLIKSH